MPSIVSNEEVDSDKLKKVNNHIESGDERIPWGAYLEEFIWQILFQEEFW